MKTKNTLLVFATEGPTTKTICADLTSIDGVHAEVVKTAQDVSKAFKAGNIGCLAFITTKFDMNSVKFVNVLRETKKNLGVIVFATEVGKDIYTFTNTTKLKRLVIMENPYKKDDLRVVCEKILNGQEVYQRSHGRFVIDQDVVIDRLPTSDKLTGQIKNMSLGGAYLEVAGELEETDTVKITIPLETGGTDAVFGEVIRVQKDAFGKGRFGIGIRFITQESLYRALLAKLG